TAKNQWPSWSDSPCIVVDSSSASKDQQYVWDSNGSRDNWWETILIKVTQSRSDVYDTLWKRQTRS
ncbi:hypothetical protein J6590_104498, partial [Homalodisca vitripennis]